MLSLQSSEPVVVSFGEGASITLVAPSPRIIAAGRMASRKARDDNADLDPTEALLVFSEGVLTAAITGWTNIGDEKGKVLECTPENVARALTDPGVFDTLDAQYVIPMMTREMEKNGSAASSAGTSKAATAAKGTASSAVGTKPKRKPAAKKTSSPKKAKR